MPASKRPRKAHRPRIIARPVFEGMRRELMIPTHAALRVLERVRDPEALEGARHTLAACLSYMAAALDGAGYEIGPIGAGLDALQAVIDRHARTGVYGATGPELVALRDALTHADGAIPALNTAELARGMLRVYAAYATDRVRADAG